MVSLKNQKRLASQVLKCGKKRVWIDPNEVDQIAAMFTDKNQTETKTTETRMWDHWIMMLVFFGLLTVEWIVRKLNGLP